MNKILKTLPFSQNAIRWCGLSLIIIVIDQITKFWAVVTLPLNQPVHIFPSFNLTLMRNTGAAFSFMARHAWSVWVFGVLAIIISVFIIFWMLRLPKDKYWLAIALALILGGALGNFIDRIHNGFVIDFIQVYYQEWYWPAFNLADSAITAGAIMLGVEALWHK